MTTAFPALRIPLILRSYLSMFLAEMGEFTEAEPIATDALAIADRSEYRLVQADAHNLIARLALDAGDRAEALRHAEIAKERAWCDGPPHCYKPALDEAEELLAKTAP